MTSRDRVYLGDRLDGSPVFHQQLHDFDAVFLAGNVQWSKAVLCKRQLVSGRHAQPLRQGMHNTASDRIVTRAVS